jgi:predicted negative regulator of RcsB-dependent stress response
MNNDFNHDEMDETEEPTTLQKVKEWTQENLRIIVSVLIVFLIASSIYSYSKRGSESEVAEVTEDSSEIENILTDLSSEEASDSKETPTKEEPKKDEIATKNTETKTQETAKVEPKKEVAQKVTESKETENSFVEMAQKGDGTTHLARRALAHYLEKNADSSLTAEHKIYIEDYLRKNVSPKGHIMVGTSVEFSKDLIKQAIDASKNLNDAQLRNLQKYSANVNF